MLISLGNIRRQRVLCRVIIGVPVLCFRSLKPCEEQTVGLASLLGRFLLLCARRSPAVSWSFSQGNLSLHSLRDGVQSGRSDPPEEWRKLFFRTPPGQRRTNLHIREVGRANQRYALLFRDYLRADARARGAYAQVKEALARLHPENLDAYYEVKDPVCDIITAAAERWVSETHYAPGPTDL